MTNKLFYGDNLDVLRERVADESVDLVYLDPPENDVDEHSICLEGYSARQDKRCRKDRPNLIGTIGLDLENSSARGIR